MESMEQIPAVQPAQSVKQRSRLTVRLQVCHEEPTGRPTPVTSAGERWLDSDEQPFLRRLTLTPEWRPLDPGWLTSASLLVIEVESRDPAALVEVGTGHLVPQQPGIRTMHSPPVQTPTAVVEPCWRVRPGMPFLAEPLALGSVFLRAQAGEVRVNVHLFPT